MTKQTLAKAFVPLFREVHALVDALPAGDAKDRLQLKLRVFHEAGDEFMGEAVKQGHVRPFDGTDKPPVGP